MIFYNILIEYLFLILFIALLVLIFTTIVFNRLRKEIFIHLKTLKNKKDERNNCLGATYVFPLYDEDTGEYMAVSLSVKAFIEMFDFVKTLDTPTVLTKKVCDGVVRDKTDIVTVFR